MILTPVAIDLEQGSEDWLRWRQEGLGASDVAAILGLSPWTTADDLWAEKLGYQERRPQTAAMKRGVDLEPTARFLFEWRMGRPFAPQCFTTLEYPWMKASLDGWSAPELWESKSPGKTSHTKYLKKGCPDFYACQVQYQLALSGGTRGHFTSYSPDFPEDQQFCVWPIERDDAYIDKMLERVIAFFGCLIRGIPPTEGMLDQSVNGLYATTF